MKLTAQQAFAAAYWEEHILYRQAQALLSTLQPDNPVPAHIEKVCLAAEQAIDRVYEAAERVRQQKLN